MLTKEYIFILRNLQILLNFKKKISKFYSPAMEILYTKKIKAKTKIRARVPLIILKIDRVTRW